jgi:putative Mg2+ transporter-C (MgtC) family protein
MEELPNGPELIGTTVRLLVAGLLGAVIGWNREQRHKAAGLRTHMLVAIGATIFVLPFAIDGGDSGDVSRVVQGLATGIGFVGAGSILKLPLQDRIEGLTTAGSIWITAALGALVGLGKVWMALLAGALAWIILSQLERFDVRRDP